MQSASSLLFTKPATRHLASGGGGGAKKMCIILNHEKTTLPILGEHFYTLWHSFQFAANLCGKNLSFIFQGQILFFGANWKS